MTFSPGANVTALNGNAIGFVDNGSIAQNSSTPVSINVPTYWSSYASVTGTGSGTLTFNNSIVCDLLQLIANTNGSRLFVTLNATNSVSRAVSVGSAEGISAGVDLTLGSDLALGNGPLYFFDGSSLRAMGGTRTVQNVCGLLSTSNNVSATFTFGAGSNLLFASGAVAAVAAATLQVDNAVTAFNGFGGSSDLIKSGPGTLLLDGNVSGFIGSWAINAGVLKLTNGASLTYARILINTNDGLDISSLSSLELASLGGPGNLDLGATALTVGGDFDNVYSGVFSANSRTNASVRKTGSGTWTLSGSNSALGSLRIENGTLALHGGGLRLGNDCTLAGTNPSLRIENGASLSNNVAVINFSPASSGNAIVTGPGSRWNIAASLELGSNGVPVGSPSMLTISNGASMSVGGAITFRTAGFRLNVDEGTLQTGGLSTVGASNVNIMLSDPNDFTSALSVGWDNSDSAFAGAIADSATAPGGIRKSGSGTLTLSGPLSYSGPTRIQGGRLIAAQSNPFAGLTEVTGGALEIHAIWGNNVGSRLQVAAGALLTGGGTVRGTLTNSGLIEIVGPNNLTVAGTLVNNGLMRIKSGASFTGTGVLVNNGVIDVLSASAFNYPAGFVNHGTILERSSMRLLISRNGSAVNLLLQPAYAGHTYTLQRSSLLATGAFTTLASSGLLTNDLAINFPTTDFGPLQFYRVLVDWPLFVP